MGDISFYEKYIKRGLDVVLSGVGAIVLIPVYAITAAAIFIEDPGPVIFKQKRVGVNKSHFELLKFRSMRLDTPHDVPTHQLDNPDQYILKTGKFIRKYSIDELPQLINIIRGDMSIVGPRPALWNQFDLIKERDRYGANRVLPGLTGWAQVNGRDELEIPVKAKMDGKYARALRKNSMTGFCIDFMVLVRTVGSVLHSEGVVEGGTGTMNKNKDSENSEVNQGSTLGFDSIVEPEYSAHKRILITGEGSYIGNSFIDYIKANYPDNFTIRTLDMLDPDWKNKSFADTDIIYHVAGIAHADVGNVSDEVKAKYYAVNTDLALEVAKKAKAEGVSEFVFMSSMIVYGDSAPFGKIKCIDKDTSMDPANFYGDSKYQADVKLRAMASENFKVLVLRPPMIYGPGSKGNYPVLAKMASMLPVFPVADNQRSMLYIENLCEFLCQLFLVPFNEFSDKGNIFIPQNAEYTKTSDMVAMIAKVKGHKIVVTKLLDVFVRLLGLVPGKIGGLVNKAFGNSIYDMSVSEYPGLDYQKISLADSIKKTEGLASDNGISNKKVLILVNHEVVIYNFRLELVEELINKGYEVHLSCPYGEKIEELKNLGVKYYECKVDRHGINPFAELKLLIYYIKLIKEVNPVVTLGYTIKPNIYGAIAASMLKVPFMANVTGLGNAVEKEGIASDLLLLLYKFAFRRVERIYFQNQYNMEYFRMHNIYPQKAYLLPGSGVNLERYPVKDYPSDDVLRFAFISRIMKEKGIDNYLEASAILKDKYPNTEYHVCGFCEKEYTGELNKYDENGTIIYHGMIDNVSEFLENIHAVVLPSYHEGMSNVLLEASASARPIITTNVPGCRELVDEGVNGYTVAVDATTDLVEAMEKIISLSNEEREKMGMAGRLKVELNYSRQIVVDAYMRDIKEIENG